jgi:ABC-type sugar transport system ATPase subunit
LPYVEVNSLSRRYGNFALHDISFSMESGEILAILGPSGAGKTSILRNICGLDRPDRGTVSIEGEDVTSVPVEKRGIGMIFQDLALFPHLTAFDNIAFGLRALRKPPSEVRSAVNEIADLFRVKDVLGRLPSQISGGQRQRVALARSVVVSPKAILMDEPLSSLDPSLRIEIRNEIKSIAQTIGLTVIYVTHDIHEALYLGDRVGIVMDGRLRRIGSQREVFLNPGKADVASFLGYNLIKIEGRMVGVFPSDFDLSVAKEDLEGSVTAVGFEGDRLRMLVDCGAYSPVTVFLPYDTALPDLRKGKKVRLKIRRRIDLDDTELS